MSINIFKWQNSLISILVFLIAISTMSEVPTHSHAESNIASLPLSEWPDAVGTAISLFDSTSEPTAKYDLLSSLAKLSENEMDQSTRKEIDSLLLRVYRSGDDAVLQRKALLALQSRETPPDGFQEFLNEQAAQENYGALALAAKWRVTSLVDWARSTLNKQTTSRDQCVLIYPSAYLSRKDASRYRHQLPRSLHVAPEDLAKAYLARLRHGDHLATLQTNFATAPAPMDVPRLNNKDKLYWYTVLLIAGSPPDTSPALPLPVE